MITERTAEHIRHLVGDSAEGAAGAVNMITSLVPRCEAWNKLVDSVLEAQKTVLKGITAMVEEQQKSLRKASNPKGPQSIPVSGKGSKKRAPRRQ